MSNEVSTGNYRCPECTGEFPHLDDGCCPWCGLKADGTYEFEPRPLVSKTTKKDDDDEPNGLRRLFT